MMMHTLCLPVSKTSPENQDSTSEDVMAVQALSHHKAMSIFLRSYPIYTLLFPGKFGVLLSYEQSLCTSSSTREQF